MVNFYKDEKDRLVEFTWKLKYDREKNTATLVNEDGKTMDFTTFSVCLEALENTRFDLNELRFGESNKEPLDELTKKRFGIRDYQLLANEEQVDKSREVFEVYSDDNDIFTMDNYLIYNNRKLYDYGFLVYLNRYDAERVLESLQAFVERGKRDDR